MKGGGALETLAHGKVLLFDKTGTLTAGIPQVADVEVFDDMPADELLRLSASLDQVSPHVLATSIVRAAREHGVVLTFPTDVVEQHGAGIEGNGRRPARRVGEGLVRVGGSTDAAEGARRPSADGARRFVVRVRRRRRGRHRRIGHRRPDPAGLPTGDPDAPSRRDQPGGHGDRRPPRRRGVGGSGSRGRPGPVRARSCREGQGGRGRARGGRDDLRRRRAERRTGARGRGRGRGDGCSRGHGVVGGGRRRPGRRPAGSDRRRHVDRPPLPADRGAERGDRHGARVRGDVPGCLRAAGPGRRRHRAGVHRRVRDPERAQGAPRRQAGSARLALERRRGSVPFRAQGVRAGGLADPDRRRSPRPDDARRDPAGARGRSRSSCWSASPSTRRRRRRSSTRSSPRRWAGRIRCRA